jgi:hypothetical protein
MSDYDLGKAHGKIEIDSDVDTDRAEKKLREVADAADKLAARAKISEPRLQAFAKKLEAIKGAAEKAKPKLDSVSASLGRLASMATLAATAQLGLGNSFQQVGENALAAGQKIWGLHQAFKELRNPAQMFFTLMRRLGGVDQSLKTSPKWVSTFLRLASAFGTVGLAATAASAAMSAFGKSVMDGRALTRLEVPIRNLVHKFGLLQRAGNAGILTQRTLGSAIYNTSKAMSSLSKNTQSAYSMMGGIIKPMRTTVLGFLVAKSGVNDLRRSFAPLISVMKKIPPLWWAIGAAALAAVKYIPALASGLLNVGRAAKELLGALLIIPGAISSLGVVAVTAVIGISGLSKAFKAGFGEADKFDEAVKGLTPRLKHFARELQSVKKEYKGFSQAIAEKAFSAMIDNFKQISLGYLPLLKSGFGSVAFGINVASRNLVNFLASKDAFQDFANLMAHSSKISFNMGSSLRPFLDGLRNIGVVGSEATAELSDGMLRVAVVFDSWTEKVRNDGSLERWIDDGVNGFRFLWRSIRDFSAGISAVFQIFGGEAALRPMRTMAEAAARFRDSMEKGAESGSKTFRSFVKVSESVNAKVKAVALAVKDLFAALTPAILGFSEALSDRFVQAVGVASAVLEMFFKILSMFDGILGTIVGQLLGVSVAFKMISAALRPHVPKLHICLTKQA